MLTREDVPAWTLEPQLTIYEVAEVRERMMKTLESCEAWTLDAAAVQEADSAGLQLLVFLRNEALRQGRSFRLLAPSAAIQELLELFHLGSELEAVAA